MKKSLLATVAAAALFAGSGLAMAEGAAKEGGAPGGGAQMQQRGGAEMNRGAEHKGGAEMKGGAEHKAQTTGQGAGMDSKSDNKAGAGKAENKAEPTMKPSTSGQTEKSGATDQKSQAQSKESPAVNKNQAQDNKQAPANRNQAQDNKNQPAAKSAQDNKADTKSNTTGQGAAGTTQAGGAVNLTTEQKTTIRKTVIQSSSAPKVQRSQINFNISVGTVVPRGGVVRFAPLPTTIVDIYPSWRGYQYFVVDEEIIIIEPTSYKIIAVLNV